MVENNKKTKEEIKTILGSLLDNGCNINWKECAVYNKGRIIRVPEQTKFQRSLVITGDYIERYYKIISSKKSCGICFTTLIKNKDGSQYCPDCKYTHIKEVN